MGDDIDLAPIKSTVSQSMTRMMQVLNAAKTGQDISAMTSVETPKETVKKRQQVRPQTATNLEAKATRFRDNPEELALFLEEIDKEEREKARRQRLRLAAAREKHRTQMIALGKNPDEGMPLRLQNVVKRNKRVADVGGYRKSYAQTQRERIAETMRKQHQEAQERRVQQERQREALLRSTKAHKPRPRALKTPVRQQALLAGSLYNVANFWAISQACIRAQKARVARVREMRALVVIQCQFRNRLRVLEFRRRNHALLVLRNWMFRALLRRRDVQKRESAQKIISFLADIRFRQSIPQALTIYRNSVLCLQDFVRGVHNRCEAQRYLAFICLFKKETELIIADVQRDQLAKTQQQYDKAMKAYRELRKRDRMKADRMGAPKLRAPPPPTEEAMREFRLPPESLQLLAALLHRDKIYRKLDGEDVSFVFYDNELLGKGIQQIREFVRLGESDVEWGLITELALRPQARLGPE